MKYTNSVSHCIDFEIKKWARKKQKKVINIIDKEILNIIKLKSDKKACSVCGKNALLCPYYFVERIYLRLKKEKVGKETLNEFAMFFNFNFENESYVEDIKLLSIL
jgi:hypothetical protein